MSPCNLSLCRWRVNCWSKYDICRRQVSRSAPRTPAFNYSGLDHHWLIEQQPPLTVNEVDRLDDEFRKRWRCLRAVDDMVAAIIDEVPPANYFLGSALE